MRPLRLVVVSAGTSQPSSTRLLADRLAEAAVRSWDAAADPVEVEVLDLRGLARDLASQIVTGLASPQLVTAARTVAEADALVAVSPIFNASYSGLFKLFFDSVSLLEDEALTGTPVLIAATGGTTRHSLALEHALRPLFAYLRASVVPTAVYAATEDWASPGDLARRIDRAAAELAALTGRRERADDPSEPVDIGGFERLLAVHGGDGARLTA